MAAELRRRLEARRQPRNQPCRNALALSNGGIEPEEYSKPVVASAIHIIAKLIIVTCWRPDEARWYVA
jgi:hypothetical protein